MSNQTKEHPNRAIVEAVMHSETVQYHIIDGDVHPHPVWIDWNANIKDVSPLTITDRVLWRIKPRKPRWQERADEVEESPNGSVPLRAFALKVALDAAAFALQHPYLDSKDGEDFDKIVEDFIDGAG